MNLTHRKLNGDPPSYRVSFERRDWLHRAPHHHITNTDYWHWGVAVMPMMSHGGGVPSGHTLTREAALQAFREARRSSNG